MKLYKELEKYKDIRDNVVKVLLDNTVDGDGTTERILNEIVNTAIWDIYYFYNKDNEPYGTHVNFINVYKETKDNGLLRTQQQISEILHT